MVKNEFSGELILLEIWIEVWVEDDNFDKDTELLTSSFNSKMILHGYVNIALKPTRASFDYCWKCNLKRHKSRF
jgi:hypothetical protein